MKSSPKGNRTSSSNGQGDILELSSTSDQVLSTRNVQWSRDQTNITEMARDGPPSGSLQGLIEDKGSECQSAMANHFQLPSW